MPGIVGHMVVAKLVGEKLGIKSDDFIRGNLLPDIIDFEDSHHKIKGKHFLVPDREYIKKIINPKDELSLGYCTHLLLDWHFLEEYIPENIDNLNIFIDKSIYKDYDYLNYKLVKKFKLNPEELEKILYNNDNNIKKDKLFYNLKCLKMKETKETKYLKEKEFSKFLFDISKVISEEIENYASETSRQSICNGK